jgi:superfamily II DNA or RNA helicase
MNLSFATIGKLDKGGTPFLVQKAIIPADCRQFWIAWRVCQDRRLKDSLSLRKEEGRWACYRTVPADPGLNLPALPMPYSLKSLTHLLPYQPRAVSAVCRSLIDHGIGIDGSDTGLGKTYVGLKVCAEMNMRPAIICRRAGIGGWMRACRLMEVEPVFIVNWEMARTGHFPFASRTHHAYEVCARGKGERRWVYKWKLPPNTLLVYDEVHMACNDDTLNNALWRAAKGLPSLALSATMADRPARLASLFDMLGICDVNAYRSWLVRNGAFYNQHNELESLSSVQDMQMIHSMLYPRYGARLSYQDQDVRSYFPGAVHQVELISLEQAQLKLQNKLYQEMVSKAAAYREMGKSHADTLVAELRYRQAAEMLKAPIIAELAQEYLADGLSVCIFVNFRDTMAALAKLLKTRSLIFGDQDRLGINREEVRLAFQANQERLIICMADAGGQSIDLHDLKGGHQRISIICPTYNPISLKQILGRTYRAGAKTVPIMKLCYAAGTVEEKVAQTVAAKLDNLDALNRGDLMESDIFNLFKGEVE